MLNINKGKGFMFVKAMSHSTIWIAVLVVHVGCIIEAQPSKSSTSTIDDSSDDHWITAESQSTLYTTFGKNSFLHDTTPPKRRSSSSRTSSRNNKLSYSSTTVATFPLSSTTELSSKEADDTCTGKEDGYYQNWGSDCTSYYFCAASYQITYVCPVGQRFTGKVCTEDYKCPKKEGFINPCGNRPNGYYAFSSSSSSITGKYFYCFKNAKVIELQCDPGKVFVNGKCTLTEVAKTSPYKYLPDPSTIISSPPAKMTNDDSSCLSKSNGFYTDWKSDCQKYYYCINNQKTGLSCQPTFLFNGDLCVVSSRYKCPYQGDNAVE